MNVVRQTKGNKTRNATQELEELSQRDCTVGQQQESGHHTGGKQSGPGETQEKNIRGGRARELAPERQKSFHRSKNRTLNKAPQIRGDK